MGEKNSKRTIVIMGTLDTKECEGHYLTNQIEEYGNEPLLMDISMRKYQPTLGKPDISNAQVAEAAGKTVEDVAAMERGQAIDIMCKGAANIVEQLYDRKKMNGVIGYGGGVGTSIVCSALKALPIGVPKLVVSTIAQHAEKFIEAKDIAVFPSVTDLTGGTRVNRVEAMILANAAAAISGMVNAKPTILEEKPIIVASQFGVTTPHIAKSKEILEDKGYELIAFHATGMGGQSLEELVRSGIAVGVLDVTTHELADTLFGGVCKVRPDRLTTAGRKGCPQVILPGALDMVNFWEPETVPESFKDRRFYHHIPRRVTLMRTNKEECAKLGKIVAEKVNEATGSTVVIIPLRGWSMYDAEGGVLTVDYYGKPTEEPWYDPEANKAFTEALEKFVDKTKHNVKVMKVDLHINDPELAELTATILDDMIRGDRKSMEE